MSTCAPPSPDELIAIERFLSAAQQVLSSEAQRQDMLRIAFRYLQYVLPHPWLPASLALRLLTSIRRMFVENGCLSQRHERNVKLVRLALYLLHHLRCIWVIRCGGPAAVAAAVTFGGSVSATAASVSSAVSQLSSQLPVSLVAGPTDTSSTGGEADAALLACIALVTSVMSDIVSFWGTEELFGMDAAAMIEQEKASYGSQSLRRLNFVDDDVLYLFFVLYPPFPHSAFGSHHAAASSASAPSDLDWRGRDVSMLDARARDQQDRAHELESLLAVIQSHEVCVGAPYES